ncbi:hypothetical protein ACMDCR_29515 [Labrys okinawensis]|uniref:hypothetical protein n=1 Tax=Labrys okinawensis TaxID=346911 RepID=UPI0039BD05C7
MKYLLLAFGLIAAAWVFAPTKADAVVCARGVYRAGCAGPNGAVVRRYPHAYVAPRGAYVAPRRTCVYRWVNGVRVCRYY